MREPTPYKALFPVGCAVRIADRDFLEEFMRTWQLHNRLQPNQLEHAGKSSKVVEVGFYHGGDPVYVLDGITWRVVGAVSATHLGLVRWTGL